MDGSQIGGGGVSLGPEFEVGHGCSGLQAPSSGLGKSGPLGNGGWIGGLVQFWTWERGRIADVLCFLNWTGPSISRAGKELWVPVQGQGGGGILQVLGTDTRPLGSSLLLLSQRLQ